MKKNILNLFLLLTVVFSPMLASNQALAQTATGQNTVPCTVLNVPPALKMGSKGAEVTKLQIALKALGYLNIPQATGFYGFKTKAAVTQAQIDWNIVPFDGVVGLKTATWIKNITCAAASGTNANLSNNTNTNTNNNQQNNNQQNNQQQNNTNTSANNQQNNQQQNNTNTTNQQQNQQAGLTQNLSVPCTANVAPMVEVDSPNGGEVFMNTDVLKISWSSCNIAPDAVVKINLLHLNDVVMSVGTTNTGSFAIQLTPALIMNPPVAPAQPIAFDKLFKVQIFTVSAAGAQVTDMSDNTFAILDSGVNPNANPGPVVPNVPVNPNQGWPLGCVWPLNVTTVFNAQPCPPNPWLVNPNPNSPTVAADVCAASPLPHVVVFAPNGGQKFQIGSPMDVLWFNCNVPAGVDVRISMIQNTNTGMVQYVLNAQTANDGFETVKLVPLAGSPALQPADNYQVMIDFVVTPAYTGPANPPWLHWGIDFSDGLIKLVN